MQYARLLRFSGLTLLGLVLAVGPFLRGLFFWTEALAATALIGLGFCLWLAGRRLEERTPSLLSGTTGIALLVLLLCYLLQFAWPVYARGNLDWVLRVAAAWAVYVMVRAEAGPALRRWLSWLLVLSAAGLTLLGFLEFTGYFATDPQMMQALGLVSLGDRMATALQYPNTAAVYLLAAIMAALGITAEDRKLWKSVVMTALITLLSLGFFFTVSRGAVVVLPFGLLLLFLGLDREKRWPVLLQLAVAWAPTVTALKGIGANAAIHNYISAFRWIGAATVGGAIGGLALGFFLRLKGKVQMALVVGAVVLAGAGLLLVRPGGALLPKQAQRLFDMNFRTANVIYRVTLDQDALKMITDRPLGRGGWGWERSYRQYQEFYYVGRETHNHYLQTAVEAGVPGLLALLAAMGAGLWAAWKNRTGDPLGWTLTTGAAVIAAHSLIDFNLSFPVVWLLFWCLLAVAGKPGDTARRERLTLGSGLAAGAALAAAAGILAVGSFYADRADLLKESKHPQEAAAAARAALRFDPWNSAPLLVLGDQASLERAERLDPRLATPHWELAVLLWNQPDYDGSLREARLAHQTYPLVSMYWDKLASVEGTLMADALHNGDPARARTLAQELTGLYAEFNQRKAAESKPGPWMGAKLQMDADAKLRYGQALYLKGDEKAAEPLLIEAAKVGLLGSEADLWLYVIYERRGDKQAMGALETKAWIRFRNANPTYKALLTWQP